MSAFDPSSTTHSRRRTPLSARGEPMVWLTGGALVVCLVMIAGLVTMIVTQGLTNFWPKPIEKVTLSTGEVFLGVPTATESNPPRSMYRTGNRDIGREPFRWVDDADIVSIERPPEAVLVEREVWSVWLGVPEQAIRVSEDGEREVVAQGFEAVMDYFDQTHGIARARLDEVNRLKRDDLGRINHRLERRRLEVRQAELEFEREGEVRQTLGLVTWLGLLIAVVIVLAGVLKLGGAAATVGQRGRLARVTRLGLAGLAFAGVVALFVHGPWRSGGMTEERLEALRAEVALAEVESQAAYDEVLGRVRELEAIDAADRLIVTEQTEGRFAPRRQIELDSPMQLSQVVRIVDANRMGFGDKMGVFISRWGEFLRAPPREANTEGGVYPVIVGTVLLTILLTITVTPLGVIAALYLREYARQGFVTGVIRIAVNNLAGVPSIVYGVFGLGFFCYTVGRYIDAGPAEEMRLPPGWWWALFAGTIAVLVGAFSAGVWSKPDPGTAPSRLQGALKKVSWIGWFLVVAMAVTLIVRTPFFTGFFEARSADGSPTFGARGMLWASLTLALLTLPVVIVSTEEAIAAVPNSMREGSYGCGASKWQTIRRIVLPGALPGILTGAILAMARGAGEVAPLMLVGAVKLNQDLPVSGEAPYVHLDRSFMHLGFHIYDLGFQSPDSQAARPLVWTTTLLLLTIVLSLNFLAILLRARLRARLSGPTV